MDITVIVGSDEGMTDGDCAPVAYAGRLTREQVERLADKLGSVPEGYAKAIVEETEVGFHVWYLNHGWEDEECHVDYIEAGDPEGASGPPRSEWEANEAGCVGNVTYDVTYVTLQETCEP